MGERKQAQVGDKIKVVNPVIPSGYSEGDILTVKRVLTAGVYVEEVSVGLYNREFEVITDPIEGKLIGGGPIKVGDKIKIKAAVMSDGKYSVGDVLTVKELRDDPFGRIHGVYVEENDQFVSYTMGEFEVVSDSGREHDMTKAGDSPVEGKTVKPGDKIRIINAMGAWGHYDDGDEFTVESVYTSDRVIVEEHPRVIARHEFEVIKEDDSFNVGDYVVVTNKVNPAAELGQVLRLVEYNGYETFKVEDIEGNVLSGAKNVDNIRKATEAEVAQAKADAIKPGDVVKVTTHDPKFGWGEVEHGDIGIVRNVRSDNLFVDFPRQSFWTALPSELELIAKAEARADRG